LGEHEADKVQIYSINPLTRFSDRAAYYAKYRPAYSQDAISCVLDGLGEPTRICAADIGAGTGIGARLIAARGIRVIAIEPNGDMRRVADPHPLVELREATAEATGLSSASVDLVTCFQSFHWFNSDTCLREFCRILKPSGRLALVWNVRDKRDAFTSDYTQVVRRASNNDLAVARTNALGAFGRSQCFAGTSQHTFPYVQTLNLEGLIGRALSASYVPREGPMNAQIASDLKGLYEKHHDELGMVHLAYTTEVYLADPSR